MDLKKLSVESLAKFIGDLKGILEFGTSSELKEEEKERFFTCYQVF